MYVFKPTDMKRLTPTVVDLLKDGGCHLNEIQIAMSHRADGMITSKQQREAYAVGATRVVLGSLEREGLAKTTGKHWKLTADLLPTEQNEIRKRKTNHVLGKTKALLAECHEAGDIATCLEIGEALSKLIAS